MLSPDNSSVISRQPCLSPQLLQERPIGIVCCCIDVLLHDWQTLHMLHSCCVIPLPLPLQMVAP
jgi:hypothetical protein